MKNKISEKKKTAACSFISLHFLSEQTEKTESMTSRTWFGEIGDDPNLSFDAMDTRIFVSATRHYRIYVTDRTQTKKVHKTQKKKKKRLPYFSLSFLSRSRTSQEAKNTARINESNGREREIKELFIDR